MNLSQITKDAIEDKANKLKEAFKEHKQPAVLDIIDYCKRAAMQGTWSVVIPVGESYNFRRYIFDPECCYEIIQEVKTQCPDICGWSFDRNNSILTIEWTRI